MHTRVGLPSIGLLLLIALAGCSEKTHAVRAATVCDAPIPIIYNAPVINVTHVYTGADGLSHAEPQHEEADTSTYLGATLREFQLGDPSNVVLMTGPPNFAYPKHPAPYREIFLVLAGSMDLELSDGTKLLEEPGSLIMFDDLTGAGHGGRFGACGYIAVDLQYQAKPAAPAKPAPAKPTPPAAH
jgi:quercetin dioxygenase-like cupin family protein